MCEVELTFKVDAADTDMLVHAYLLIKRQYGISDEPDYLVKQVADTVSDWVEILDDAGHHPCSTCRAKLHNSRRAK